MGSIELPIIVVDTREKQPYAFEKTNKCGGFIRQTLPTGDYSLQGLESVVAVERKSSIAEAWNSFLTEKIRFLAEIERLRAFKYKYLILEFDYANILHGCPFSKVPPPYIISCLLNLSVNYGIHIVFGGDRASSRDFVRRLLLKIFKEENGRKILSAKSEGNCAGGNSA